MPTTIHPFQPEDWQDICRIHDAAKPHELKDSCDPRAFVPTEKDPEVEHLKLCQKLVAVGNGQVIGFVGVHENYLLCTSTRTLMAEGVGERSSMQA
ncbi:MAG: hypothetical protein KAH12_09515 [Anaerolineales bacterium]|nr:hypothetical protein [Anaerolineales bacterium]